MVNISVPYNPVPQVTPQDIATPYRTDVGATPEAFGAGVGAAVERLGGRVEQVGDVLAQQALVRQDLTNRAAVDKADAQFMTEAGAEHLKFSSLEGGDRAAYYPTYIKNLQTIRERIRGSLPNMMTQRLFDTQSLSTLGRTIFNGAGAAGSGAAEDRAKSAALRSNAISDQGGLAENETQANDLAKQNYRAGVAEARATGVTNPIALDEAGKKRAGEVYHNWITGKLADENSGQAQEMLDKHAGAMTDQQRESAQRTVRSQRESVEVANEASNLIKANTNDDGTLKQPVDKIVEQTAERGKELHPKDPEFALRLKTQVDTQLKRKVQEDKLTLGQNLNTINTLILAGASSEQEIRANPQGKLALDSLPKWVDVTKKVRQLVDSRDEVQSRDTIALLKQEANDRPHDFLSRDPYDPRLHLNTSGITQMITLQNQVAKGLGPKDSRPDIAMHTMMTYDAAAMKAAGVDKKADPETYDLFKARTADALEAWRNTHAGRPPTDDDVAKVIMPTLIKGIAHKYNRFFGMGPEASENVAAFQRMDLPGADETATAAKFEEFAKPLRAMGYEDMQIARRFYREKLQGVFAKEALGAGLKARAAGKPTLPNLVEPGK